jgi:triphosphoribosyl-dephospho-CoA synthase
MSMLNRGGQRHTFAGDNGARRGGMAGADIAVAAQLACLLEASAPKPGNVSPGHHFADVGYADFLVSAVAIGTPLAGAADRPLGETVRLAIDATARWTRANTNLGIVLLLSPLARAAAASPRLTPGRDASWLRASVRRVLEATTVEDAHEVFAAIRRAAPGGLGRADDQDVAGEPSMTLVEVMRLAAHRDGIAREYATGFEVTFETAAPALARARRDGLSWDDAVVETFLTLLSANADTHVERRSGPALAAQASALARVALGVGGVRTAAGRLAIETMDAALRDPRNHGNPGTTADLTAAALFVELLARGYDENLGVV